MFDLVKFPSALIDPLPDGVCTPTLEGMLNGAQMARGERTRWRRFLQALEDVDGADAGLNLEPVTRLRFVRVQHSCPSGKRLASL
jgi:hypothetical protein